MATLDTRTIMMGKAVVITTAGAIAAYASITVEGIKGSHNFDKEEVKDFAGFDQSWIARNEHIEITLSLKLTGTGQAQAANTNGVFLTPLTAIVLSGFPLPWLNAAGTAGIYTGNWQYIGGDITLSADKAGVSEVKARKYADPTQNTASTTLASA